MRGADTEARRPTPESRGLYALATGFQAGPVGEGYRSALAWRFSLRVGEDPATWVGLVNAHDGAVLALYDDNDYAQVKGGVYPVSNDQMCPDGCEQTGYPMPFASSRSTTCGVLLACY